MKVVCKLQQNLQSEQTKKISLFSFLSAILQIKWTVCIHQLNKQHSWEILICDPTLPLASSLALSHRMLKGQLVPKYIHLLFLFEACTSLLLPFLESD